MTNGPRSPLPSPKTPDELLNEYYLLMRSAVVETAAGFDRIQRAGGGEEVMKKDARIQDLQEACRILVSEENGRVERILDALSVEDES